MALFRTWLEKAYKTLEDKERQLANLNKVQGSLDDIKAFVSDVMTHGADLKFLTISGQKFVDLSKVGVTNIFTFHCYRCDNIYCHMLSTIYIFVYTRVFTK
jgi:hypothetical protein